MLRSSPTPTPHFPPPAASHEAAVLRQEVDGFKSELHRTHTDRLQLSAQLEVRHRDFAYL
jgi:hypothetical protein